MSWSCSFGGHTDSPDTEGRVRAIMGRAAEELGDILGEDGFSAFFSGAHHSTGDPRNQEVVRDEPVTPPVPGGREDR